MTEQTQKSVRLACGGTLAEGGTFYADDGTGVVERHDGAQVLPPGRIFEDAEVVAGGRRWNLTRDRLYLTREAAVAGEIPDAEADLARWRRQIEGGEARLKRLYAQRAELAEWKGAWPGQEVPG
jgi:hypothetical protein